MGIELVKAWHGLQKSFLRQVLTVGGVLAQHAGKSADALRVIPRRDLRSHNCDSYNAASLTFWMRTAAQICDVVTIGFTT
jgi:hypothetical protein